MNKLTHILSILIVLLLIAIGATWYLKQAAVPPATEATYTDFTATLPSSNGGSVTVDNFLKDPMVKADTNNEGSYYLGNSFIPASTTESKPPAYVVTYDSKAGYFNVVLLQKPFAIAQSDAQAYLRDLLKLDDAGMCGLSYTLSVPGYVDENASGIDYRFSFCPDSIRIQ